MFMARPAIPYRTICAAAHLYYVLQDISNQNKSSNSLLLHWNYTVPYMVNFVNCIVVGSPSAGYLPK